MGVRHRGEELQEEREPGVGRQALLVAEEVQPGAVHVFEHQIGVARVGHAGIDEATDAGMGEPRERAAFPAEPLRDGVARQRVAQQLDGDFGLVAPVDPPAQPHAAHAALSERTHQQVRTDAGARGRRGLEQSRAGAPAEESACLELGLAAEQQLELRRHGRPVAPECQDPVRSLRVSQLQRLVEQRSQDSERIGVDAAHPGAASSRR